MSNFTPFGQLEYHPVQITPPQAQFTQFPAAPQQQQQHPPPLHSSQSATQPEYNSPQSVSHIPRTGLHSDRDNFGWALNNITTLLHAQHREVSAKLEALSLQQSTLSVKVEALQRATNTYGNGKVSLLTAVQNTTSEVVRLGTDMASRDAMLAARLSALDDAIDPEGKVLTANDIDPEALQTPPASDVHLNEVGVQLGENGVQLSDLELQPVIQATRAQTSPEPVSDGSSSPLSSLQPTPIRPTSHNGTALSLPNNGGGISKPTKEKRESDTTNPSSVRRSSRPSKKRKIIDISANASTPGKKPRSTTKGAPKTPVKKPITEKSSALKFEWANVPFREEGELRDTLIQCESCDVWYHWACVNIDPEDPLLQDEDEHWFCPPCAFEASCDPSPKTRTRSERQGKCRPDCANGEEPEDKFIIESLVGRFPNLSVEGGKTMLYLVKWESYPLSEAIWTPEEEIGHRLPVLIQRFEEVAKREGRGKALSNKQGFILLTEASDAGWGYNRAPST